MATHELTPEMIGCHVYPNPASTEVTISLSQEAMTPFNTYRLALIDESGQVLQSEVISNPTTQLPVVDLAPGIYFLRVVDDDDNHAIFKIIKI